MGIARRVVVCQFSSSNPCCICDRTRQFASPEPVGADPLTDYLTDDRDRLIPVSVGWIERCCDCRQRVTAVADGQIDWKSEGSPASRIAIPTSSAIWLIDVLKMAR